MLDCKQTHNKSPLFNLQFNQFVKLNYWWVKELMSEFFLHHLKMCLFMQPCLLFQSWRDPSWFLALQAAQIISSSERLWVWGLGDAVQTSWTNHLCAGGNPQPYMFKSFTFSPSLITNHSCGSSIVGAGKHLKHASLWLRNSQDFKQLSYLMFSIIMLWQIIKRASLKSSPSIITWLLGTVSW